MSKRPSQNTLYSNDNLYVLSGLNSEFVDLIYLDPPFNTKRMYDVFLLPSLNTMDKKERTGYP